MITKEDKQKIKKREKEYFGKYQTYTRELKIVLHALELHKRGINSEEIDFRLEKIR